MRTFFVWPTLLAVASFLADSPACGAESLEAAVAKTRRELEMLKIQQRLFWQVEHPRQMQELDAAIELTRAEVDALEETVRRAQRLDEFRHHEPFLDSLQRAELALLEAELRLRGLVQERLLLRRSFSDRCRLLELQIAEVRAQLATLERLRLSNLP